MPSRREQPDISGMLQVPSAFPGSQLQMPPQHSTHDEQASPFCVQNEDELQTPSRQKPEQQSAPVVQGLSRVRHVALSGTHTEPEQVPLQQAPADEHGWPSAVHGPSAHTPHALHLPQQQSAAETHAEPREEQPPLLALVVADELVVLGPELGPAPAPIKPVPPVPVPAPLVPVPLPVVATPPAPPLPVAPLPVAPLSPTWTAPVHPAAIAPPTGTAKAVRTSTRGSRRIGGSPSRAPDPACPQDTPTRTPIASGPSPA
jgi:hypothetical protein